MPSESLKVSPLLNKDAVTVEDFNRLVTELNKVLSEVNVALGKVRGEDGATSKFSSGIDADGNTISNVKEINFSSRKHVSSRRSYSGLYVLDDVDPASATVGALRNDLTDNVMPSVETALNDIGTYLKEVLTVLKI